MTGEETKAENDKRTRQIRQALGVKVSCRTGVGVGVRGAACGQERVAGRGRNEGGQGSHTRVWGNRKDGDGGAWQGEGGGSMPRLMD